MEYESYLVLGSISGSFVANDMYERIVSTVKIAYKPKQQVLKSLPHEKRPVMQKMVANTRHSIITPKHVARVIDMSLDTAKHVRKLTTQQDICTAVHPLHLR